MVSIAGKTWSSGSAGGTASTVLTSAESPLALRYRASRLIEEPARERRNRRMARALNVLVASVGIVLTAPLMVAVAIAIKLTSRGPVLFTQERVGIDRRRTVGRVNHRRSVNRGGRIFTIYKFRTMSVAGDTSPQMWATRDDPRITFIGKFLRATRLDELPQFFNVLKGDMNIVGPRPEQPEIFDRLRSELGGRYGRRQRVLPGITGLAQVNLGYDTDIEGVRRKVDFDLEYIRSRSASTDLEIMAKTVPVMVFRKVWM
jgi:lipopolysaccharide/colanic/teichoic acid biosynthesis glycosyltransferase